MLNAWEAQAIFPSTMALQTVIADRQGNVWVAGTAAQDSILKFTREGKLLWDFGHRPPKDGPPLKENNQQTDVLVSKGRFNLDEDAHEIYIINWKRVLVYDMDTGAFKRGWGGHGMPLSEISNDPIPPYKWTGAPPPEEKNFVPDLHFAEISKDGMVYIGERGEDRISRYHRQMDSGFLGYRRIRLVVARIAAVFHQTRRCLRAGPRIRWSSPRIRSRSICT